LTPNLPVVSGLDCIKALEKVGYQAVRQKGNHIRLKDINEKKSPITIPAHKELRPGLLKKVLRDAELTVEEFKQLL